MAFEGDEMEAFSKSPLIEAEMGKKTKEKYNNITLDIVEPLIDFNDRESDAIEREDTSRGDVFKVVSASFVAIPPGPAAFAESMRSRRSEKPIRPMRMTPRISSQIIVVANIRF